MNDNKIQYFKKLNDIIVTYSSEKSEMKRQGFFRDVHDFYKNYKNRANNIFDIYSIDPAAFKTFVRKWDTNMIRVKKLEKLLDE